MLYIYTYVYVLYMYRAQTLSINLFRKSFYSSPFCHVDCALTSFLLLPMSTNLLLYLLYRIWT